jgi:small subunit ribosomal protein S1
VKHPSELLTLSDKIDVVVLELDVDGRKLSLGHKQTHENPWDKYASEFAVDSIHKTSITEIVDKGGIIKFNDDVIAFVPQRHMEKEDGSKLTKGEEVDFKIIEFNKEFKRVVASHTNLFKEQEKLNYNRAAKKVKESNSEKTTLGDLDALADLKQKMNDNG